MWRLVTNIERSLFIEIESNQTKSCKAWNITIFEDNYQQNPENLNSNKNTYTSGNIYSGHLGKRSVSEDLYIDEDGFNVIDKDYEVQSTKNDDLLPQNFGLKHFTKPTKTSNHKLVASKTIEKYKSLSKKKKLKLIKYTNKSPLPRSFKKLTKIDEFTRRIDFETPKSRPKRNLDNNQKINVDKPLHTFCARDKHKIYSLPWNLNTVVIR